MDALPKTTPIAGSPVAAATSPASAPAKSRSTAPAAGAEDVATTDQGADAFMAALLAQGSMALLNAAETAPAATPAGGSSEAVAAQALPLTRPALAALLPGALRPISAGAVSTEASSDGGATELADDAPLPALTMALEGDSTPPVVAADARVARGEATGSAPITALDFARDSARGFELVATETGATSGDSASLQGTGRAAPVVTEQPTYGQRHAPLPVADAALFAERLNQQITVMINQHNQHARIACAPPELGPVDVRISLVGDEASVQLAAPHAATREALEEALPRLRAALADSGLALGQAGVFADMPQRQQQASTHLDGEQQRALQSSERDQSDLLPAPPPARLTRLGLVDAFV